MSWASITPKTATPIPAGTLDPAQDAKLRKSSRDMEGVFVQQMYKAMRTTVPDGGMFNGGGGEEMFTGLLDEHIAANTPATWQHRGLSEAIYRQLRAALPDAAPVTIAEDVMSLPDGQGS